MREVRTERLPGATSKPVPAPPSLAGSPPLHSHEVFGYAPYWTLPQSSGFDVKDLTTLAYFSVDANADGTLWSVGNVNAGILLVFCLTSIGVYGISLAGWASGSKFPLLGSVRSTAQMISYELAMSMSVS